MLGFLFFLNSSLIPMYRMEDYENTSSVWLWNIVKKGTFAHDEQMLPFQKCFQNPPDKDVSMW